MLKKKVKNDSLLVRKFKIDLLNKRKKNHWEAVASLASSASSIVAIFTLLFTVYISNKQLKQNIL